MEKLEWLFLEILEGIEISFFSELEKDDVLFVDSSLAIAFEDNPLFKYLDLISALHTAVIVHLHDIFHLENS